MASTPTRQWLQNAIISLLSAPGPLHIPKLPFGRGGPGPIDVFSSRFANLFTDTVVATVNGEETDNAGLKDKLVVLKKNFDPSTATFSDVDTGTASNDTDDRVATKLQWTQGNSDAASTGMTTSNEVTFDAQLQAAGSLHKISQIDITTELLPN